MVNGTKNGTDDAGSNSNCDSLQYFTHMPFRKAWIYFFFFL